MAFLSVPLMLLCRDLLNYGARGRGAENRDIEEEGLAMQADCESINQTEVSRI